MNKTNLIINLAIGLVSMFIPVWLFLVVPWLLSIPRDFHYQADIVSVDNFYDEKNGLFKGEQYSKTSFSYAVVGEQNQNLVIQNTFSVSTLDGKPIYKAEPKYLIDRITGKHVGEEGYLFGPKNVFRSPPQEYQFWHVVSKNPAVMKYVGVEYLYGLKVYRYETDYGGAIDQTESLNFLPGVGRTRGVRLESKNIIWVEPISGHLVKQEDFSTDYYYYDLVSGNRIGPYNQFLNYYTEKSVRHHVEEAKGEMSRSLLLQFGITGLLVIVLIFLILVKFQLGVSIFRFVSIHILEIATFVVLIMATFVMARYVQYLMYTHIEDLLDDRTREVQTIIENEIALYGNLKIVASENMSKDLPGVSKIDYVTKKDLGKTVHDVEKRRFDLASETNKTVYVAKPEGFWLVNPTDSGFTLIDFNSKSLLEAIVPKSFGGIKISIYDGLKINSESLIYTSTEADFESNSKEVVFREIVTIFVAGHPWTLVLTSSPNSYGPVTERYLSRILLIVGTIFSVVSFWLVYSILNSRRQAAILARQLTEDLSRKLEELNKTNRLMVGRELKMIELKKEIERLNNLTRIRKDESYG